MRSVLPRPERFAGRDSLAGDAAEGKLSGRASAKLLRAGCDWRWDECLLSCELDSLLGAESHAGLRGCGTVASCAAGVRGKICSQCSRDGCLTMWGTQTHCGKGSEYTVPHSDPSDVAQTVIAKRGLIQCGGGMCGYMGLYPFGYTPVPLMNPANMFTRRS